MSGNEPVAPVKSSSKWMTMLRAAGAICGCFSIAVGLYQLITSVLNPRSIINGAYQIIFGLLILIAEARWSGLLKHFKFLTHFLGLGLFYIFVGGLVLGGEWYQYAEAILCLAVGSVYLLLGVACRTMAEPGFGGKPVEHSKYGEPGNRKAGQPDPVQDLKKKAAHAAVDHAIESGTNPFA